MEDLRIARRSSVSKVQANCIFKSTKNELLKQKLKVKTDRTGSEQIQESIMQ